MGGRDGITIIDTGFGERPEFCAAYLLVEAGRAALIDCGTLHSVPRMLAALDAAGVARDAVDHLIVTHVHLDHAGGAGALLRELPNARLVVHPRGAPHMVDPAKLIASARQVYGDSLFDLAYGGLVPAPAERVLEAADGQVVDLARRPLLLAHTPGHALHHLAVWDARTRSWFCGDIFGISYRELDVDGRPFAIPTTSPVQFDPGQMKASVLRMLAESPDACFLTHYGRITDVARVGAGLVEQVDAMVAIARTLGDAPDRHAVLKRELTALYVERARRHGIAEAEWQVPALLEMDIELNAQGLAVWLARERRKALEAG
ncbi:MULTISPECIES: MBL fold metallo-hydrolase [unclassified Luteimonas]|uniref:MBL fold metallo-hydrolase n=1 Tax=unclassified Luteimonas TaxID=2629088 RepID=UPI0016022384|nr:MBL fold metallo-hydrolase [Luteimonas sp. MC1825]MBB1473611.1 MBL fold metallo-hydrolase [Luteimonas sp. MC1782]MBB6600174.1 MBL fold metallo-hydrolase [Luteimonas sp. MC1825]QOC87865.1 MBL fold metallo-hydrolase [Luteimonas sp. MC1825]